MRNVLIGGAAILLATAAPAQTTGSASDREAAMFSRSAGYERFMGRWSRQLAVEYVAFAGLKNGDRVLDVGTGTGAVANRIAATWPASEVVGIDPSEGFIAFARKSAPSARVRFEIGDAQSLKFPDASFDQTLALLVVNFIPDPAKAIGEMRRVTRPNGTVSACVWDYDSGMQMTRFFWDELVALEPSLASKDQRNMKFARQGELGEAWRKAGLAQVDEKPLVIDQAYASFDDYWQPFLEATGASGALVATLSSDQRTQLESRLRKRLLGDRADGPFVLKARAWCVKGRA